MADFEGIQNAIDEYEKAMVRDSPFLTKYKITAMKLSSVSPDGRVWWDLTVNLELKSEGKSDG